MHSRYPRHPNKLAQDRRLNSAFSMYLRVHYTEVHNCTGVSSLTEITGLVAVFPQPPNFQGHILTGFRHNNLTAWGKKIKSISFGFGAVQHRLYARISLSVCMCIHIFRKRRVSFNLTKRRRRGKKKRCPGPMPSLKPTNTIVTRFEKLPVQCVQTENKRLLCK